MRNNFVIGNWKMKLDVDDSLELARDLKRLTAKKAWQKQVVLCPNFLSLAQVGKIINKTKLYLGAQDCFWEDVGAYTGEVSPKNLKVLGCKFVILGHSERRRNVHEDAHMIREETKAVLHNKLTPIVCLGENKIEKAKKKTKIVLRRQFRAVFSDLKITDKQKVIVAYEPIWAIGNGNSLSADKTAEVLKFLEAEAKKIFPKKIVDNNFYFIYGGSVNAENVADFASNLTIQGLLVGSESLIAKNFVKICKAMLE